MSRPSTYQIRSTPCYQRTYRNNLRNVQLEKLREEYEQIHEINDRTIEWRIRQLRLSRLFREIEQIKSRDASTSHHRYRPIQKTNAQLRGEQLAQARKLGKDFSQFNGLNHTHYMLPSSSRMSAGDKAKSRELINKRISYGNQKSLENRGKCSEVPSEPPQRKEWSNGLLRNVSSIELSKQEMLRSRLMYGNECSFVNRQRTNKRKTLTNPRQKSKTSSVPRLRLTTSLCSSSVNTIDNVDCVSSDTSLDASQAVLNVQTYYTMSSHGPQRTTTPFDFGRQTDTKPSTSEINPINHERALANWGKLRDHLRRISEETRGDFEHAYCADIKTDTDANENEEFCLRSISNDVNLPTSQIKCAIEQNFDLFDESEENNDRELLLNVHCFLNSQGVSSSAALSYEDARCILSKKRDVALQSPQIPEISQKYDALSLPKQNEEKCCGMEEAINKSGACNVHKLRTLFERSN